jgi:3-oxoadipate enol-lactonase/4-carboxymuconolactone decarboxylase
MPFVSVGKTRIFYRLEGAEELPVLTFSHSIGTDHSMWAPQAQVLQSHFRILRYDTRGHGASDTPEGDYTVEQLGQDFLGLLDALKISSVAYCGLSMGGAVGQWLALHARDRISALVLANTGPRIGTTETWNARIDAVRKKGMAAIADAVMQRFFSSESLTRKKVHAASVRSVFLGTNPAGYIACCIALRDFDATKDLKQIQVPTLVIGGNHDVSTPWQGCSEILAKEIPGARAARLATTHLSNLEQPHAFNAALMDFLLPKSEGLDAGMAARQRVLGKAHVDRSIANTTEFTREFQSLIATYAWGALWTRPGLDDRIRRFLVFSITAAMGRWDEFRLHIAAALKDGMETGEIKEVLLQTAIYAGIPAGNTAFHIAQEEIEKLTAS